MITNYFISPHPSLMPFVDNYTLSTSHGKKITLNSNWPASNETSLIFYMADQPYHYTSDNMLSPLQHDRGCIVGLQSKCNGMVYFNGVYYTFLIQFKANGFNKLFRIPAGDFVNELYYLDEVFGKDGKKLNDELQQTKDIQQMACLADGFLLHFLNAQKTTSNLYDGITFISNKLLANNSLLSVEQYAYNANMSVRNFGRRFTEQIGVSPKLYLRLLRFNTAITARIKNPNISWTSIAYDCGYYDQMHMIKDFKEFANVNPSSLFESNEKFTRPQAALSTSNDNVGELNTDMFNERFITVKRTSY